MTSSLTSLSTCITLRQKSIKHLSYVLELLYPQLNNLLLKKVRLTSFNLSLCIGGRILVFASNISSSGFGNLMYREDPKLYNTDKEKVLLSPVNDTYTKMAEECI